MKTPKDARPRSVRRLRLGAGLVLGTAMALGGAGAAHAGRVDAEVAEKFNTMRGTEVDVVVTFKRPEGVASLRRGDARSLAALAEQIAQMRSRVIAQVPGLGQRTDIETFSHLPLIGLRVDQATAYALADHPDVDSVTYSEPVHSSMVQAGAVAHVPEAVALGYRGAGITVAVLDTGIDTDHPDFTVDNAIVAQHCALTTSCPTGANAAEDGQGHGTHVAGIITRADGTAPDAKIAAVKVLSDTGFSEGNSTLGGLNWVVANHATHGIRVVNMSLGGSTYYTTRAACDAARPGYAEAFAALRAVGVTSFVATGNEAQLNGIPSPACHTGSVGVGSTGDATFNVSFDNCTDNGAVDKVSCYSNTHVNTANNTSLVTLMAPGCLINSTRRGGGTPVANCGTSMATPFAAGLAANLLGRNGTLTPDDLTELLVNSATNVTDYRLTGASASFQFKRVDLLAAHQLLGAAPPPTDLTADDVSASQIDLDWTAPAGATPSGYRIERLSENETEWVSLGDIGPAVTYSDTAPKCGLQTYRVRSLDDSETPPLVSLPSNEASATAFECPLAPSALTATISGNSVALAWTDGSSDETGFVLQRQINGGAFTDVTSTIPANATAYTDAAPGCGFIGYRIAAVRGSDRSAWSNVASVGLCAPANDLFANATEVTPTGSVSFTEQYISLATSSAGDPVYSCRYNGAGPGSNGIWYKFTPTTATRVVASTAASTGAVDDTLLGIYTHNGSAFTQVACNDDISTSVFLSRIEYTMAANQTYYLFVSTWTELPPGSVGTLALDLTFTPPPSAPPHDLIANARVISATPYSDSVLDMQLATVTAGDPVHTCRSNAVGSHNVWYRFTAPSDGTIALDTVGSSGSYADTVLSVYTGSTPPLSSIGCNDDGSGTASVLSGIAVTGGTTYTVHVSRYSATATTSSGALQFAFQFTSSASPSIAVDDTPIALEVAAGSSGSETLVIGNEGDAPLTWTISEADADGAEGVQAYHYDRPGNWSFAAPAAFDRTSGRAPQAGVAPRSTPYAVVGGPVGGLTEAFDDIDLLPAAGWFMQNNSNPVGTLSWFQGNTENFVAHQGAADAYMSVGYGSTTGGTGLISNWLLTPEVTLQNGTTLRFYTRRAGDDPTTEYADRLQVRLSTNGASTNVGSTATDVGDFTTLMLTINPNLNATDYPHVWTEYVAVVEGLPAPTTGRFAFRYFVENGGPTGVNSNIIGIDTVSVGMSTGCDVPTDQDWLSVTPASGTTAPGTSTDVTVNVDAGDLVPGEYAAQLCINSNDSATPRVTVPVSLTVVAGVEFTPETLPGGQVGEAYSATITATSETAVEPFTYSVTDGTVPPGLTLFASGVLSGEPTQDGSFTFTVTATDSSTPTAISASQTYTVDIAEAAPVVVITPAVLPNALIDAPYSQQLNAGGAGTTAPYSFAVTGVLPTGLSLSSDGLLAGTPTELGTFNFTVTVTDADGNEGSQAYTVLVVDEFVFADGFEPIAVPKIVLQGSGKQRVALPVATELALSGRDAQQPVADLLFKGQRVGVAEARCVAGQCEVRVLWRGADAKWAVGDWWPLDRDPYEIDVEVGAKLLRDVQPAKR